MISVKDQVSMMYGKEIADTLEAEGLLARNRQEVTTNIEVEPTHWKLHVRLGPNAPEQGWVATMNAKIARVLSTGQKLHSQYGQVKPSDPHSCEIVFDNHRVAAAQRTMAKNMGLVTELIPYVLVRLDVARERSRY